MMPYDTYRLCEIGRAKNLAEVRRADEQAARVASAISPLFRSITRLARAAPAWQRLRQVKAAIDSSDMIRFHHPIPPARYRSPGSPGTAPGRCRTARGLTHDG